MPELAEVRLTADYVNRVVENKIFNGISKNPNHKGKEMEANFPFEIKANSRGKEFMLTLSTADLFATPENLQIKHIIMTMGMSGHFKWLEPGETTRNSHLFFHASDGGMLAFVDVRRFGKWNWGWWNTSRGPDPVLHPEEFKKNIKDNLRKRAFDKPLMEVLMNQEYFNGIGNYLRAEIINRLDDVNPFQPARDAIVSGKGERLLELCSELPKQAYLLGGGNLYTWETPKGIEIHTSLGSWTDWMKCYGNKEMSSMMDNIGRRFWFDPKWSN